MLLNLNRRIYCSKCGIAALCHDGGSLPSNTRVCELTVDNVEPMPRVPIVTERPPFLQAKLDESWEAVWAAWCAYVRECDAVQERGSTRPADSLYRWLNLVASAMRAEGVDAETTTRVLNVLKFGDSRGNIHAQWPGA